MSASNLTRPLHPVRSLACGALIATFAFAGGAPAHAADRIVVADCPSVDVVPSASNTDDIRAAVLCLTNAARAKRDMRPLRENAKLRRAALAHSSDMVRGGYFAHTAPDGDTFVDRILGAGYARRGDRWTLGENLAWGTGNVATARAIHGAWMRSRGHRANILKPAYRQLGIGVRVGVPSDADVGATFTTDFGAKS
jgi:uncharacterized protein YkwD